MAEKRMVFFHSSRLAKEFKMQTKAVGILLKELGCVKWSECSSARGSTWYWEDEKT